MRKSLQRQSEVVELGRLVSHVAGTVILAGIGWVGLGYLLTMPLGLVFGWSGHPAIPAAPVAVYVLIYIVVLPVLCLAGAWRLMGRVLRSK